MKLIEIKERNFVFITMWCLASIFHSLTFTYFDDGISSTVECFRLIILVICIIQILHKKNYYFFIVALILNTSIFIRHSSSLPNHIFFEGIINLVILCYLILFILKYKFGKLNTDEIQTKLYSYLSPIIIITLGLLYFFVVIHKSNEHFFDPFISCSADFFSGLMHDYRLTKIQAIAAFHDNYYVGLRYLSIYFAFLSELIIPILLFTKKFKNLGIVYGIFFHTILAFYFHLGIYSFSAMMFSYYTFFFSSESIRHFSSFFKSKTFKTSFILLLLIVFTSYCLLPNSENSSFYVASSKLFTIGFYVFFIFALVFYFQFIKSIGSLKSLLKKEYSNKLKFNLKISGVIVILFIFFNGICPYLGLKTESAFSMFSNLRTEGNLNNHLFIPESLRLFSYQDNPIIIKETNIEILKIYEKDSNLRIIPFSLNMIIEEEICF